MTGEAVESLTRSERAAAPLTGCVLCGDPRRPLLFDLRTVQVVRCPTCRLVYVHPQPLSAGAIEYYHPVDFSALEAYYQPFRMRTYRRALTLLKRDHDAGRVLDIGASFGWFVACARQEGYDATGIEPSPEAVQRARQAGLQVIQGDHRQLAALPDHSFQIVSLWNVLEHIQDPLELLSAIRAKLTHDGIVLIAVPNLEGFIHRLIIAAYHLSGGRVVRPLQILYQFRSAAIHLYHFSSATLLALLHKAGFVEAFTYRQAIVDPRQIAHRITVEPQLTHRLWRSRPAVAAIRGALGACHWVAERFDLHDELVVGARVRRGR